MMGDLRVFCDLPTEVRAFLQRSQDAAFNLAWTQVSLPGTISNVLGCSVKRIIFFPFSGFLWYNKPPATVRKEGK